MSDHTKTPERLAFEQALILHQECQDGVRERWCTIAEAEEAAATCEAARLAMLKAEGLL